MNDMLRMQKEEANQAFAKFVKRNYEQWIANADERPLISPDVFKRCIFPRLSAGRKVFLLVLDNLRFDQWRAISARFGRGLRILRRTCTIAFYLRLHNMHVMHFLPD